MNLNVSCDRSFARRAQNPSIADVIFQVEPAVSPATWFDLWEVIDEYLSIAESGQPMIIRGDAYAPDELNFFESFSFESVADSMVPVSTYMFTSYVRTTCRGRNLTGEVSLRNLRATFD